MQSINSGLFAGAQEQPKPSETANPPIARLPGGALEEQHRGSSRFFTHVPMHGGDRPAFPAHSSCPVYTSAGAKQDGMPTEVDRDTKQCSFPVQGATHNRVALLSTSGRASDPMEICSFEDSDETNSSGDSFDDSVTQFDAPENSVEAARAFLRERGIDIQAGDAAGAAALIASAWEGQCDIVENLLVAGVDVNCAHARTGDNALILAASLGHIDVIGVLLRTPGIALDRANRNGDTALMLAASGDWTDVVSMLLQHGAQANVANRRRGYTALLLAADYGLVRVVDILLKVPGIELNAANQLGDTALILAAAGKRFEVVQALLNAGASMAPADALGHTALSAAIVAEHAGIVELFLDRGAKLSALDTRPASLSASQSVFSVTVSDLASAQGNFCGFPSQGNPLAFFHGLSGSISPNGDVQGVQGWLRSQGMLAACARELASILTPARAWALEAAKGKRDRLEQHRLIYCISAVSQLAVGNAAERVLDVYRQAGISDKAIARRAPLVKSQLGGLAELAAKAAAQFGGDLIGMLIASCLAQTSPRYEVRPGDLKDCLAQAGFIEPLAGVIASGWQTVLAGIRGKTTRTPEGLSLLDTIEYVHQNVIGDAQAVLARALKENLKQRSLLTSFEVALVPSHEEVVHMLFQIQCDWLSQFCEQSLAS